LADLTDFVWENGACEKEQEGRIRSQNISRQGWRGKNNIEISEGSDCFFAGCRCGRGFLHSEGQDQAHIWEL
jgi:hypothetical protein